MFRPYFLIPVPILTESSPFPANENISTSTWGVSSTKNAFKVLTGADWKNNITHLNMCWAALLPVRDKPTEVLWWSLSLGSVGPRHKPQTGGALQRWLTFWNLLQLHNWCLGPQPEGTEANLPSNAWFKRNYVSYLMEHCEIANYFILLLSFELQPVNEK